MTLLVVHAAATWFMVGLSWMIQAVHYPLFARVGAERFASYEEEHQRRMGVLLAVPWGVEGVTAAWLVVAPPAGIGRALPLVGAALVAVLVGVTVGVAVPAHEGLRRGFSAATHRRLLRGDRVRTAAWTLRGFVAAALLLTG